jgi:hypothetical protein
VKELEEYYWSRGGLLEENLKSFVINIRFTSSNEDTDARDSTAKNRNSVKQ